jgi:3-hydroxyacyl-[acyl-carrier-protein] dehydratase
MPAEPLRLPLEIEDIKKVLPHRYPFLLVDRILEMEEDRRVLGREERLRQRALLHRRPRRAARAARLHLTEAMAQAGAVLILAKPENRARLIYFMGIDRVRYRRPVSAGDTVLLEGTVVRLRARMGSLRGVARVDGRVVCEGR